MKKLAKNHCIFVQISHFLIQNHRFCCSRCIDEPQNVAKSFIFIENSLKNSLFFEQKIMFSRMLVCRWSPQKSLDFHSKCERFMQNPRFHRSTYVDETKNAAKSFIFIGNSLKNSSTGKACRSTEPPNAMPKSRQIVDTCTLFFTTSRSTEPSNRMPKSRHIVDSCTLLFTASRSTGAAKHDAQIATNRRIILSPFYDVQVDRGSQTRCPNRDHGRQKLKNIAAE